MAKKIAIMEDLEKQAFLDSDETEEEAKKFFTREDGSPSYYIIDDRGNFEDIQERVEELIIKCGCSVLVFDVLTDVYAGKDIGFQEKFMGFQKSLVKQYSISIINVVHTRKTASGQVSASNGAILDEESIIGSGAQYRSAGINLSMRRNKMAEKQVDQNTVEIYCSKNRAASRTGLACKLFYDIDKARFFDYEQYKRDNADLFEEDNNSSSY